LNGETRLSREHAIDGFTHTADRSRSALAFAMAASPITAGAAMTPASLTVTGMIKVSGYEHLHGFVRLETPEGAGGDAGAAVTDAESGAAPACLVEARPP
jgi:hypothetical protein